MTPRFKYFYILTRTTTHKTKSNLPLRMLNVIKREVYVVSYTLTLKYTCQRCLLILKLFTKNLRKLCEKRDQLKYVTVA